MEIKGLDLLWDREEKWWQSTVLWWKNWKIYKIYPRDLLSMDDLIKYKDMQNEYANKNIEINLTNPITYLWDKINKLSVKVLELSDIFINWWDINTKEDVIIHEITKVEWTRLDESWLDSNYITDLIEKELNDESIIWHIWWVNVKVVWSKNWILDLVITDISVWIRQFINGEDIWSLEISWIVEAILADIELYFFRV